MTFRLYLVAVAASLVVSVGLADVIVMKTGERITGRVVRFERGEHSLASSHFVLEVESKEQKVPLFKIDTVTFRGGAATEGEAPRPSVALPAASLPPASKPAVSEEREESGDYWLSSTSKRHNSSCRYYKSSKGRPCGAKDGVACKLCGG
jgi:hypothetical protein